MKTGSAMAVSGRDDTTGEHQPGEYALGTYANALQDDARSCVRILSTLHAGRQSLLTLQFGDNGAAPGNNRTAQPWR